MEQEIIKIIESKGTTYIAINEINSIQKIYELLNNNQIYKPTNNIENHYLGWYYGIIKIDYKLMKKYYLIGINNNCIISMNMLGNYYYNQKKYDLMKKYYLMAIDKNCTYTMNNFGYYYKTIEKNYDLMKKYYLMAIDREFVESMYNLASYYQNVEQNYDLMKKYYLMAIDKKCIMSMYNLASYYQTVEKNYDLMKKYYLMAIDNDNTNSLNNLIYYYDNHNLLIEKLEFFVNYINKIERIEIINTINELAKTKLNKDDHKKFVDIIIDFEFEDNDDILPIIKTLVGSIKYKMDIAQLHFEYSLEGKGFKEAKEDFYNKII